MDARIEPLSSKLPSLSWRWDTETDILSGSFKTSGKSAGLTGTVELSDEAGSVAVLDVSGGVIRGLDMVIWPPVSSDPRLAPPAPARDGRVVLPARPSQPGIASVELDTTLSVISNADESAFHLLVGSRRQAEVVRVADRLLVEVDQKGRLAGFWLLGVPRFEGEVEEIEGIED
jgi:hypothetical protein